MRKLGILVALTTASAAVGIAPAVAGAQTQPTPEVTAFCDAALKADKAVAKFDSGGKPKQKDLQAADTALAGAESTAPPEIASQVQAVVATTRSSLQRGKDPSDDPTFDQNFNALQQYRYNSCGYTQLDVTGIDYEFQGLPKTLPAGNAAIRFTDSGAEIHELDIVRVKSKDSARKIAGMSEKDLAKTTERVGGTFAIQGQTSYTIADLKKPGRYVAVCHLPVGSTSEQAAEQAGKKHAETHAQQGMYQEVKVEGSSTTSSTAASG